MGLINIKNMGYIIASFCLSTSIWWILLTMHQHHHLNPPSPSIRRSTTTTPHLFISPSSTSTNNTGGCAAPAPTTAAAPRSASALASHPHFSLSSPISKQQAASRCVLVFLVCGVSSVKHQTPAEGGGLHIREEGRWMGMCVGHWPTPSSTVNRCWPTKNYTENGCWPPMSYTEKVCLSTTQLQYCE